MFKDNHKKVFLMVYDDNIGFFGITGGYYQGLYRGERNPYNKNYRVYWNTKGNMLIELKEKKNNE